VGSKRVLLGAGVSYLHAGRSACAGFVESVWVREDHVAMGGDNPEESLEIGRGVFKRLGDCTGSEIESAIGLIAQRRIDRAWIAEQSAGSDRGELTIARRFFADATDAERDLIAYWQMVKLVEDAYLRYTRGGDA
jgi:hypothetical protein